MILNKQDYLGWRESPITKDFMAVVVEEINQAVSNLVEFAGDNPLQDKYRRGMIEGLKFLIDWVPTVQSEDSEDATSAGSQDSY